ncbi:MAG: hypothetical protein ABIR77_02235, partial [Sphingomicrobium sp.]
PPFSKPISAISLKGYIPEQGYTGKVNLFLRVASEQTSVEVGNGSFEIVLPLSIERGEQFESQTEASNSFIPKEAETSEDARVLSFLMINARFA